MTDLRTYTVTVHQVVKVTLDADAFDDAFMAEYRRNLYPFHTLEDHASHLGQLAARNLYDLSRHLPDEFVEGYGPIGEMGISAKVMADRTEVEVARGQPEAEGGIR